MSKDKGEGEKKRKSKNVKEERQENKIEKGIGAEK